MPWYITKKDGTRVEVDPRTCSATQLLMMRKGVRSPNRVQEWRGTAEKPERVVPVRRVLGEEET